MTEEVLPGYTWSKKEGRYYSSKTGKVVTAAFILLLLRRLIQDAEQRQGDLATAYYEGRIDPSIFVEQMSVEQRRNVLLTTALAAGGFAMLDSAMLSKASQSLYDTNSKIVGTAQDVKDGKVSLPQLLVRIAGYVGAARTLYYVTTRDNAPDTQDGMTSISRRILDAGSNSCPDCIEYADAGWQLSDQTPAPGERCACAGNCRCSVIQRDVPTAELDSWLGTKN